MLRQLLRRLFRPRSRSARASVSPVPIVAPTAAASAAPITVSVLDAVPSAPAAVADKTLATSYDAAASWGQHLELAHALQLNDPDSADNSDASALLKLLSDGPDAVIRQLPAAARDSLTLCDDTTLTRSGVAEKLGRDPALVQALLRTANSAAFGGGRGPVLGIEQALDRIGIAGARAVVLSSCVDGLLSHPGGEYNAMASQVWAHMVRTAPLARTVAPAFAADADEAFAIALLHDVGKLIIFDRISVLRAVRRRAIALSPFFIHQLLQLLHEPLGAMAALKWGMGERATRAIGNHHRLELHTYRDPLAESIFVAERTDHAVRRGTTYDIDALWSDGRLTGSHVRATAALHHVLAAA